MSNKLFYYCKECGEKFGLSTIQYFDAQKGEDCAFCLTSPEKLNHIHLNEVISKLVTYRDALLLIDKWGEWCPECALPKEWPHKENGKPKSPREIVKEALNA